ncbi:ADP-ribosylglycohydrolase family protein [Nocardia yamanashiensis]|uniref:ADP-ribosylglycohydrolase family protein n=1 Tax=Nocardia yamanashiensis TaxID=209247 RepID=UPI001E44E199|nr:ADP-ribosylglycohydrolase family protein [Nocardia yamanashiensis]UGT41963.1 ADP-ribosylglycohydrolase family protein [Nocardia yamanashiensis]
MLRRGELFAGYRIEREVGRGGMGSVYAARHPRLPRMTALKLLHPEMFGDNDTRVRFEREADVVARLDHPNIITVYDRGAEGDQLWIAMQYVDGQDGATVDWRALSPERAVEIIIQTAAALDYAHGKGVLHRDVKPANILLSHSAGTATGFSERVLLSDFGIARVLDDTAHLTRTGTLNATLAYASPEQLSADPLDARSDQYSLACTLFRLLTGRGPYDAPSIATVLLGHIQGTPPTVVSFRHDLPPELDRVLARALAKDPRERFTSCTEFAEAAWDAVNPPAGPTVVTRREPPPESSNGSARSQREIVHGCMLGGAVGDALGAPVEMMLLPNILQRYGSRGMTGSGDTYKGKITDETQLALFTMEALIRSSVRARARGIGGATVAMIQENLLVWLQGQGVSLPEQPFALRSGLSGYPELMSYRGPTHATTTAMQRAAERRQPGSPLGTRDRPINDSKGCAGVVRAAPIGFLHSLPSAFESACDAAALTHGNPSGWLPAGTLAATVFGLSRGLDLRTSLNHAASELARHRDHQETSEALATAIRLADAAAGAGGVMPEPEILDPLGFGVIGPDALAIAVCAALCAETIGGTPEQIFRNGVLLAVNHSGDSDSTGAICGNLLGARLGVQAIPAEWHARLDAAPIIDRLATDFCTEFGPNPPSNAYGEPSDEWYARYPG